jgi:hypothetical protein
MFAGIDYELFDLINRRWTQTSADLIFLLATDPSSLYQATPRQAPHGPTLTISPADPPPLKLWRGTLSQGKYSQSLCDKTKVNQAFCHEFTN